MVNPPSETPNFFLKKNPKICPLNLKFKRHPRSTESLNKHNNHQNPHRDRPSRGDHQIQPRKTQPRFAASPPKHARTNDKTTHARTDEPREKHDERGNDDPTREREAAGWNSPCAAALYSGPARGRRCERGCVARGLGTAGGSAIYSRAGAGRGSGGRRSEVGPHGVRVRVYLSFGAESILASRAGMHVRTWRADTDRMAPRRRRSHPLAGRQ